MVVRARCCCGCTYFMDSFDRATDHLAPDGVNYLDSNRWVLTTGDWEVDPGTDYLLCNTAASPIYWYDDSGTGVVLNTLYTIRMLDLSSTVTLIAGPVQIKLSFPAANKLKIEFVGGDTWTLTAGSNYTFPMTGTLGYSFFLTETYDTTAECYPYPEDGIMITGSMVALANNCHMKLGAIADADYDQHGLMATVGVRVNDVTVEFARPDCETAPAPTCNLSCYPNPIPNTITVNVSDLPPAAHKVCVDLETAEDCFDEWNEACQDCEEDCQDTRDACYIPCFGDPGCIATCDAAHTACMTACDTGPDGACYKFDHYCETCWDTNADCWQGCPCDEANGAYVLTRETQPYNVATDANVATGPFGDCACIYTGVFPFDASWENPATGNGHNEDCDNLVTRASQLVAAGYESTYYLLFRVQYTISSYDCVTGEIHYNLTFLSSSISHPSTVVPTTVTTPRVASAFCGGTNLDYRCTNISNSVGVVAKNATTGAYGTFGGCDCFTYGVTNGPCDIADEDCVDFDEEGFPIPAETCVSIDT